MKAIISEWRKQNHISIPINQRTHMDTIRFADDHVLLAVTEDDLQRLIYSLSKAVTVFNMEISTEKSKVMAFKDRTPIGSEICLNNKILEQVNKFKYLGHSVSCREKIDTQAKH
jgi:hypothetical protein